MFLFFIFFVPNFNFMKAGKLLDRRAQQLLKNLLDYATERISRSHSKVNFSHCCEFKLQQQVLVC